MENRYHMSNASRRVFVEAPHTRLGKTRLEMYRREHPDFKGCRIVSIIQAYPSKIPVYQIHHYTR